MFQKLLRKDCFIHRREHHIMLHLKFGKTNHMITNQTFGHWVVYFMKVLPSSHLSELRICKDSTRKC